MTNTTFAIVLSAVLCASADAEDLWVEYPGSGADAKTVVLVAGDEEYRSEETLPQLGKILSVRHGFRCFVLFPVNDEGYVDPNHNSNIPGLHHLADADLMVLFTRFRNLPDEQMKHIADYVEAGKPIVAMRTSTHGFNPDKNSGYRKYGWQNFGIVDGWRGGFGKTVLGETWVAHHGKHGKEATRGRIAPGAEDHPILRGVDDGAVFGPTDVYAVRLPLPEDSRSLVLGEVVAGMDPTDPAVEGKKNDPMMPIAWTRDWEAPNGETARIFVTTMGASQDFANEAVRRLIVNGCYWAMGLEDEIPLRSHVEVVDEFDPTPFGFGGFRKGLRPSDFDRKP